jgi:hypothetical protein
MARSCSPRSSGKPTAGNERRVVRNMWDTPGRRENEHGYDRRLACPSPADMPGPSMHGLSPHTSRGSSDVQPLQPVTYTQSPGNLQGSSRISSSFLPPRALHSSCRCVWSWCQRGQRNPTAGLMLTSPWAIRGTAAHGLDSHVSAGRMPTAARDRGAARAMPGRSTSAGAAPSPVRHVVSPRRHASSDRRRPRRKTMQTLTRSRVPTVVRVSHRGPHTTLCQHREEGAMSDGIRGMRRGIRQAQRREEGDRV